MFSLFISRHEFNLQLLHTMTLTSTENIKMSLILFLSDVHIDIFHPRIHKDLMLIVSSLFAAATTKRLELKLVQCWTVNVFVKGHKQGDL